MTSSVKYHKISSNTADGDVELSSPTASLSDEITSPLQTEVKEQNSNGDGPSEKVAGLTSVCFSYIYDVFELSKVRPLEENDFMLLPNDCSAAINGELLKSHWKKKTVSGSGSSLTWALVNIYGRQYLCIGIYLFFATLLQFLGPIFLNLLVDCVSKPESVATIYAVTLYTVLLIASKVSIAFISTQYAFHVGNLSIAVSAAIKTTIYQKMLRLSTESKREYGSGTLSNLYTVDIERVVGIMMSLHNFWALPLQILVAMCLLYQAVGMAMFGGLITIVLILMLNKYIATLHKKANDKLMTSKDTRMKIVGELFRNLLNIKFMAWENPFLERITVARGIELSYIRIVLFLTALNIWLLWLAPQTVSTTTIAVYAIMLRNDVRASTIFTAISLFRLLQDPLRSLPSFIAQFYQALSSLERLQGFYVSLDKVSVKSDVVSNKLAGMIYIHSTTDAVYRWCHQANDTHGGDAVVSNLNSATRSSGSGKSRRDSDYEIIPLDDDNDNDESMKDNPGELSIGVKSAHNKEQRNTLPVWWWQVECMTSPFCFTKSSSKVEEDSKQPPNSNFTLVISKQFCILPGQLVVIQGKIGSGKSSMCAAMLGEMYFYQPESPTMSMNDNNPLRLHGTIAYSSQQSWIQNMSVKENILCGLPHVTEKYNRVIYACMLEQDLLELPNGDATHIGEKGLNLSGGQRARVALARCVYADANIILLDDIFAALDATVGRNVFERCLLNLCAGKTRVLVTHNTDIINHPSVDQLLTIDNGVVSSPQCNKLYTAEEERKDHAAAVENKVCSILDVSTPSACAPVDDMNSAKNTSIEAQEERARGKVDAKVYRFYFDALGGFLPIVFLCFVQFSWQSLSISADIFLSHWSQESDSLQGHRLFHNIMTYSLFAIGSGCIVLVRTITVSTIGYFAAKKLFHKMLLSLMYAPMNYHDQNPSGRILNRMSDDQARIDCELPIAFGSVLATVFSVCGDILTVCIVTRFLIFAIIPSAIAYYHVMGVYLQASREIKRLQSVSQSPILTLMNATIDGMYIIRAFGDTNSRRFSEKNEDLINNNSNIAYVANAASAWFVLRIQLLGAIILCVICVVALFIGRSYLTPGMIALSITYGLSISNGLQSLVGIIAWFENSMVCPERIQQYVDILPEGTQQQKELYRSQSDTEVVVHEGGPGNSSFDLSTLKGSIEFQNVSFRYQPTSENVLNEVTFEAKAGEKIGIVGRTGSGKSTIATALFRIAELAVGRILLDGFDVATLPLAILRNAIQIIPQNPVIFKGKLREFLDPFEEYSDKSVMEAVEKSQLSTSIRKNLHDTGKGVDCLNNSKEEILNYELDENGENLSVGERQLLVLARALLRGAKVLILDESTANVDHSTDKDIQDVIRVEFKDATCFTIAHRIDTIINCDRVIVMSNGRIIENASPQDLLLVNGHFKALYDSHIAGPTTEKAQ